MNIDTSQLEALAAVVSEGTFDAAARTLHVTPSAVSQRLKSLETSLGRVLVTRTKPVRPTPGGEVILRLARQMQALTADALDQIGAGPDEPTAPAVISLAVNADSLATWFPAALTAAGSRYIYDVHRDDQDLTVHWLRNGTVMAAITSVAEPVPGCRVQRLGRMRYHAACAAGFAREWFADGATVEELRAAPVVVYDRTDLLQERYLRRRTRRPVPAPRHYVPDTTAFVRAVAGGLGWGMLLDQQIAGLPEAPVLLDRERTIDVTLYWQQWKLSSAALDAVAEAVRAAAAAALV
jgi:LysR family transcriptional regulator, chromosome initiation inhibitor